MIALLALGRTQDEQSVYTQQQQQAGDNPTTDALLGGAPQRYGFQSRAAAVWHRGNQSRSELHWNAGQLNGSRHKVVEQVGKNLTFTYASNVNTTSQQLIQAEIAVNRHVSLLVTQDESGIFSVVVKNRRRFR